MLLALLSYGLSTSDWPPLLLHVSHSYDSAIMLASNYAVLRSLQESRVTLKALDQSSRYADLSLDEATLIKRPSCKSESESTVLGLNFVHKDPAVRCACVCVCGWVWVV